MTAIHTHNFSGETVKSHADALNCLLDSAIPFHTTFLFLEPGCEAVGQGTPLARAIEAAMRRSFRLWEQTWIRPRVEDLAACNTHEDLLAALQNILKEVGPGYGQDDEPGTLNAVARIARAAIAKAEGR